MIALDIHRYVLERRHPASETPHGAGAALNSSLVAVDLDVDAAGVDGNAAERGSGDEMTQAMASPGSAADADAPPPPRVPSTGLAEAFASSSAAAASHK